MKETTLPHRAAHLKALKAKNRRENNCSEKDEIKKISERGRKESTLETHAGSN